MEENLQNIHEATMRILEETGVRFYHPEIIEIIEANGVRVSGDTAYFTQGQVMEWINKAPSSFKIYARNSKYDMTIGGDNIQYASANSGFPFISEYDGTVRQALFSDYLNFLKLIEQTPYFNVNGGVMVTPSDLDVENLYPSLLYSTILHSEKCIFGGMGGAREAEMTMEMLEIVFGGKDSLLEKPRILTIISSTSPLQFDKTMLDTMLTYVKHGQPIIVAPAVMAGTTGPITLGGTIAISNAEALAGIVVAQMIREGAPVIYGSASSTSDMRDGCFCIGTPESALCVSYCARLARHYGIPSRGGGTLNDAKSISMQAGYESMMVLLVASQEKINYVLHSAGSLGSYTTMSYEKYIADLEIIAMVKQFTKGVNTDKTSLALDVISEIGPGGEFLTTNHTFENFRNAAFMPEISVRGVLNKGQSPEERFLANINKKKEKMLNSYEKPKLPTSIQSDLLQYLKSNGVDCSQLV